MKKHGFLLGLVGLVFFFTSCKNNNSSKTTEHNNPDLSLIEESEIDELANDSDLDFDDAFVAYGDGDYASAADYIDAAIEDLKEESSDMTTSAKEKVEKSISALKHLSEQVREGKVLDMETLEDVFAQAEMTVAHDYLIFSELYVLEQPEKSKSALKKAIEKIENATGKLEGKAKTEANKLLAETKMLLKKGDAKTDEIGNATGRQVIKVESWIKEHNKELANKLTPKSDPGN